MNFTKALSLAERNSHLIGKEYNGGIIDDIIIFPTDPQSFDRFAKIYISSKNPQKAILPFTNQDVDVGVVVDKYRIDSQSVFLYTSLFTLPDHLDQILE